MKVVLTQEQKDMIEKYIVWEGKTYQEVADMLELSYTYIRRYATSNNLKPIYQNKQWLQEQYDTYIHTNIIAKKYNFKSATIDLWSRKLNIIKNEKIRMSAKKYSLDENYFETIDTEEKAYWLGFIMADGCITRTEKKYEPNRFELLLQNQESEHILLNKFKQDIKTDIPIKIFTNTNKKYSFETEEIQLRINSKMFVRNLINNGITEKKTGKENVPNTVPNILIHHFIRGFFDGDGCIKKDNRISLGSSSRLILEQINSFLKKELDFEFKIYERAEYKVPFYLFESSDFKKNKAFLDLIYKDSTIYLERKYNKYLSLICPPLQ